jgi:hypothetical protein
MTAATKGGPTDRHRDKADLTAKVIRYLRSLPKLPALVRSFFRAPEVP